MDLISIERKAGKAFELRVRGHALTIDMSKEEGGADDGMNPVELLASSLGALIELPAMLWADRLIRRHGSHRILGVTMLLYAVGHGFVVLSPSVGAILAAAALGGVTFSFYSVGIVVFLSERAPLGQTATILALYTSTLRSLISMAAAPAAGVVFDLAGPYWLYVGGVTGSLLAALIFRLFITGRRSKAGAGP